MLAFEEDAPLENQKESYLNRGKNAYLKVRLLGVPQRYKRDEGRVFRREQRIAG